VRPRRVPRRGRARPLPPPPRRARTAAAPDRGDGQRTCGRRDLGGPASPVRGEVRLAPTDRAAAARGAPARERRAAPPRGARRGDRPGRAGGPRHERLNPCRCRRRGPAAPTRRTRRGDLSGPFLSTGDESRGASLEGMAAADPDDFVHLHVHTDYSLLDGASKIDRLVDETVRQGQKAVAITDHGYLFGAYEFYRAAKNAGIKPIVGIEAYVTPGTSRHDRTRQQWGTREQQLAVDDVSARGAYTHLTLLSRTTAGMHNLFRLGSYASLEGQMGKWPRMD